MTKPKNILVITYWAFESALIKTYTLPYVYQIKNNLPEGSKIWLFTLSPTINSVEAHEKIDELEKNGIYLLNFRYTPFGFKMAVKMGWILCYLFLFSIFKRINTLHSWCTPGGAIAYAISVLTGKDLVLDSFEPHAIPMVEGNTWHENGLAYKLLMALEKRQYKKAKYVITAAPGMDKFSEKIYGVVRHDCFVKPACVNLEQFSLRYKKDKELLKALDLEDKIVCVYAGKFGGLYLEKETFELLKIGADHFGEKFRVLLLTNHSDEEINNYCIEANLDRRFIIKQFVPHEKIASYIGLADFAICPVKPLPSRIYSAPIKNSEYWALGLPVIITKNISSDSDTITNHNIGYVLQDLNSEEYHKAMEKISQLMKAKDLTSKIRHIAESQRSYAISEKIYRAIYCA